MFSKMLLFSIFPFATQFNATPPAIQRFRLSISLDIEVTNFKTISSIKKIINDSNTVLWNGPAGYFENPNFQNGTKQILEIISQKTKNDKIFSVAGGGETVAAINKFNKLNSFTFVSTAGGAFLEYLEGRTLPGIKALNQNV